MKKTHIRGILFDKDGTLLDNNMLWAPVGAALSKMIADSYSLDASEARKVTTAIGFNSAGTELLANSPLASGTVSDVAEAVKKELDRICGNVDFEKLKEQTAETIENAIGKNVRLIRPIGNIKRFFEFLKSRNILIGLATADLYSTTVICLRQLGIENYFSYIGTDDGKTRPKPHPDLLFRFCETCNLESREVAVVGDSIADIEMGKNGTAGMTVAIIPDFNTDMAAYGADITVDSVEKIRDYL